MGQIFTTLLNKLSDILNKMSNILNESITLDRINSVLDINMNGGQSAVINLQTLAGTCEDRKTFRNIRSTNVERVRDPNRLVERNWIKRSLIPHTTVFEVKFRDNWEEYEIFRLLGCGAFGEVYEAKICRKEHNDEGNWQFIAIKFLKDPSKDKELRVISSMPATAFDTPHLIKYRAFHKGTSAFSSIGSCGRYCSLGLLFMDVARNGSLIDWLIRSNEREKRQYFTCRLARMAMRDIISGLAHLHRHGVYHRDLKCDNVFIDGQGRFIIGDLGNALVVDRASGRVVGEWFISPVEYNAPELAIYQKQNRTVNVELADLMGKSDIWSLGTILFSLIFAVGVWTTPALKRAGLKKTLLDKDYNNDRPKNTKFWQVWENIWDAKELGPNYDDDLKQLLNRLISYHPQHRPSADELESATLHKNIGTDGSLGWLASDDVASTDELESELNCRVVGMNTHIKFFNTRRGWVLLKGVVRMMGSRKFHAEDQDKKRVQTFPADFTVRPRYLWSRLAFGTKRQLKKEAGLLSKSLTAAIKQDISENSSELEEHSYTIAEQPVSVEVTDTVMSLQVEIVEHSDSGDVSILKFLLSVLAVKDEPDQSAITEEDWDSPLKLISKLSSRSTSDKNMGIGRNENEQPAPFKSPSPPSSRLRGRSRSFSPGASARKIGGREDKKSVRLIAKVVKDHGDDSHLRTVLNHAFANDSLYSVWEFKGIL